VHNGNYIDDHYTIARVEPWGTFAEYSNLPASAIPGEQGIQSSSLSFIDYNGDGLKDALINNPNLQPSTSLWMKYGQRIRTGPDRRRQTGEKERSRTSTVTASRTSPTSPVQVLP